jgi:deoxyribonuclease V
MKALDLHPWRVSYEQALAIQAALRRRVRLTPLRRAPRLVAGADVAYSRPTHRMYAAVVVMELPSFEVVETAESVSMARFPYIPGLFSFREIPPLLRAFRRLRSVPDVILFDGQGLAHPRRFGLACHAGVLLATPTIGCAKSRLVGEHADVGTRRGDRADLRVDGEVVGVALRTRPTVKAVYVSPGHRVDIASAVDLVLATSQRFRLPEPLRLAHHATNALMRRTDSRLSLPRRRGYPDLIKSIRTRRGHFRQ